MHEIHVSLCVYACKLLLGAALFVQETEREERKKGETEKREREEDREREDGESQFCSWRNHFF